MRELPILMRLVGLGRAVVGPAKVGSLEVGGRQMLGETIGGQAAGGAELRWAGRAYLKVDN